MSFDYEGLQKYNVAEITKAEKERLEREQEKADKGGSMNLEIISALRRDLEVIHHCQICKHHEKGGVFAEGRGYNHSFCKANTHIPIMIKYRAAEKGQCGPDGKMYEEKNHDQ